MENCKSCYLSLAAKILSLMCRAKYPLATISQLLELLPPGLGVGYDIACSFTGTVARSSLDPQAWHLGLHMVVPAFHGHAHNRLCQLEYHIQMSSGFGLEDLETCEHVFASSNMVARLTRHATPFHRRQFIDMHFQHWDEEKYQSVRTQENPNNYLRHPDLRTVQLRSDPTPRQSPSSQLICPCIISLPILGPYPYS